MTDAMKRLRELRERQSRERQRMAELSREAELNDETRAELDRIEAGTPDLERQLRAAQVAADVEGAGEPRTAEPDAELRERRALRERASLTEFLTARMQGRMVRGPEAELVAAAEVRDGAIPLELWDTPTELERRAATVSPSTVGVNLDAIQPAVFAHSIAPKLGIQMPRVASGSYASATISTSLTAAALAKGTGAEATAAAFSTTVATPKRISARLSIQIEDIAAVGQANFESALRENLSLVLSDALDDQALNGDGTAPNLSGLFAGLTTPTPATAVITWDGFAALPASGVDGLWASTIRDISIVVGPQTYRLASTLFQSTETYAGEMSAAAYAMSTSGGFWTNKRMPAAASSGQRDKTQEAILYRMGRSMMGGAGAMRTAVCPHWNQVTIDDIYSGSASGTRHFTMHVLLGDVIIVQPDAYEHISIKVVA